MGKKGRKTRWRTLTIADEQSDSEESHTTDSHQHQPTKSHAYQYQQYQNKYYSKLPYSSHSTPTRRFPYDQSTRSSSTASENKITFNEDEYTKITTPRQDVLFKKGYLNKPKNYMTQTSTGNSTTSTGNSTGNGTPDHHSADGTEGTDLEYESSQFVYPTNGFVDQNGIYYINSYEPYPLVVYNAPFCFPEYQQNLKAKRYSTGSLTESTSPNNEEVTNHDLSQAGSEVLPNHQVPEFGPVYNVVYPGFYYNGSVCQEGDVVVVNGQQHQQQQERQETRRLKKRRRRKLSKSKVTHDGATSEYTDECETSDEESNKSLPHRTIKDVQKAPSTKETKEVENVDPNNAKVEDVDIKDAKTEITSIKETAKCTKSEIADATSVGTDENSGLKEGSNEKGAEAQGCDIEEQEEGDPKPLDSHIPNGVQNGIVPDTDTTNCDTAKMTSLKADAQEFVPRAYRQPLEYVNFQPNLVPVPFIPAPNFIPPIQPIPINFIPQFITNAAPAEAAVETAPKSETNVRNIDEKTERVERIVPTPNETLPRTKPPQSDIDIEKIVLKLEEAAKEQQMNEKLKKKYQKVRPTFEKKRYQKPYVNNTTKPPEETQRQIQKQQPVYAEMLKKTQKCPRFDRKTTPKVVPNKKDAPNQEIKPQQTVTSPQKVKSQWIPVSSRKKRKNKTFEEADEMEETEPDLNADEFESYDVSMLVDIVPPSSLKEKENENVNIEKKEEKEEKTPKVVDVLVENKTTIETVFVVDVADDDIKNEEDTKVTLDKTEESSTVKEDTDINVSVDVVPDHTKIVVEETLEKIEEVVTASKNEPKSAESDINKRRKGKKAPKTKRVIITDAIFIVEPQKETTTAQSVVVEEKVKTKEVSMKVEVVTPKSDVQESSAVEVVEEKESNVVAVKENKESSISAKVVEEKEEKDKKVKRKKKKSTPKVISASSSNTTLNMDDSYDFLLDGNVLGTDDKTNVEMSQEIDRMIQKGMYNSLEEKIKSLDIGFVADGFFKSVAFTAPKPATFDAAFLNRKPAKSTFVAPSEGRQEPKPSTSKSGAFFESSPGDDGVEKKSPDQLYPITRAVREWMDKTRETTPEIEILKSPSTIYKEFCESDEETETSSESDQKNVLCNPPLGTEKIATKTGERVESVVVDVVDVDDVNDGKEVTLFSQVEPEGDLLECWEDEISSSPPAPPATVLSKRKSTPEKNVEKAEDVLEIYESKYGKNEDYLKLKAEIEEKMKTYPKHGNLPYRAICCNIM